MFLKTSLIRKKYYLSVLLCVIFISLLMKFEVFDFYKYILYVSIRFFCVKSQHNSTNFIWQYLCGFHPPGIRLVVFIYGVNSLVILSRLLKEPVHFKPWYHIIVNLWPTSIYNIKKNNKFLILFLPSLMIE